MCQQLLWLVKSLYYSYKVKLSWYDSYGLTHTFACFDKFDIKLYLINAQLMMDDKMQPNYEVTERTT